MEFQAENCVRLVKLHGIEAPTRGRAPRVDSNTCTRLAPEFRPSEARRLALTLGFYFTFRYASWMNIAELELAVITPTT
jgi:hypothetical protein